MTALKPSKALADFLGFRVEDLRWPTSSNKTRALTETGRGALFPYCWVVGNKGICYIGFAFP